MLTRLLMFLCDLSPGLRRGLWRWWYGKLARQIVTNNWTLMNYGYVPSESVKPLPLQPEDEPDRLCLQLYERVTSSAPVQGRQVLEVGSGRGGGASYLARYQQPAKITGVDFSPDAVAFCRQRHRAIANLQFTVGDAEDLSFPDASFDVVVNVESSHCYGNVEKFFHEAARVLRPGGCFAFADLRTAPEMEQLKAMLASKVHWQRIEEEDLTACVAAALKADDARKRATIRELVPAKWRDLFEEFAGVEGGKVFRGLEKRELLYFRFVFQKT